MKFLLFESVVHLAQPPERYAIDWDNGERKYKVAYYGIRVYENDLIQVSRSGLRDPIWRSEVRSRYDLDFRLRSELSGYTLFNPDIGCPIPKTYLNGNLFLFDKKWMRLYDASKYNYAFTFLSEHAQPSSKYPITYKVTNKSKYKEKMNAFEKHFALGETLCALNPRDVPHFDEYKFQYEFQKMLQGRHGATGALIGVPQDFTNPEVQRFCKTLATHKKKAKKVVSDATKDVFSPPYLVIKEK